MLVCLSEGVVLSDEQRAQMGRLPRPGSPKWTGVACASKATDCVR